MKAISKNNCCEKCQEAKSYALAALEKIRNLNGGVMNDRDKTKQNG